MRILRSITTALTVGALALVPVQASAEENDLAKILAGAVAIGIIAAAVDRERDRKKERAERAERAQSVDLPAFRLGEERARERAAMGLPYVKPRHGHIERSHVQGFKRKPLPNRCLRTIVTRNGERPAYNARCLDRNFQHARRLPHRCEIAVRTNRGVQPFYGARCLRRDGWRVAHR